MTSESMVNFLCDSIRKRVNGAYEAMPGEDLPMQDFLDWSRRTSDMLRLQYIIADSGEDGMLECCVPDGIVTKENAEAYLATIKDVCLSQEDEHPKIFQYSVGLIGELMEELKKEILAEIEKEEEPSKEEILGGIENLFSAVLEDSAAGYAFKTGDLVICKPRDESKINDSNRNFNIYARVVEVDRGSGLLVMDKYLSCGRLHHKRKDSCVWVHDLQEMEREALYRPMSREDEDRFSEGLETLLRQPRYLPVKERCTIEETLKSVRAAIEKRPDAVKALKEETDREL